MQEVILFYNGLDVPTRQILDLKGVMLTKKAVDVKIAIQEMAEYSQKWHNGTSRARIGCKQYKGPHYTKDCPLKEEGKTLEEAYYTQFGAPYQSGGIEQQLRDSTRGTMQTLRASVSVMPLSTYLNLGLGELTHTKLTVELADMIVKYPKGIAENVLVEKNQLDLHQYAVSIKKIQRICACTSPDHKGMKTYTPYPGASIRRIPGLRKKFRLSLKNDMPPRDKPKIDDKDNFELKGQVLKELRNNTFNGSKHEDANKHIEKVLEIVDLFHIPNITQDQIMLRAFPMSLTRVVSRWLRNKPSGSITTWEDLKQVPDETLNQSWERFKELLIKCPQHYLTEMQEHNGASRARSTKTSDGLATIQAQLNNLGREIKKVNVKVYAAQVGCEQCKGPHYTKDCRLKEEGASIKTLEVQIGQISKVLQERGLGSLPSSTEANPRDDVKAISSNDEVDLKLIRRMRSPPIRPNSLEASHIDNSIPRNEKDPGSFTFPCYINNVCFDNALANLGSSVNVMPLLTYLNLGLGE
ncbi:hypothetical protein Tco_0518248 [Tanacetum coccineum]